MWKDRVRLANPILPPFTGGFILLVLYSNNSTSIESTIGSGILGGSLPSSVGGFFSEHIKTMRL